MSDDRMSRAEASSLRRIVRDRFRLLRAQMPVRQAELMAEIRTEVEDDYADQVSLANVEGEGLEQEVRELEERVADFRARCHARGLASPGYRSLTGWQAKAATKEIGRRAVAVDVQRRKADLAMQEQEVGLLELLSVRDLASGEAMEFLGRIPTTDKLLHKPKLEELPAGEDDE